MKKNLYMYLIIFLSIIFLILIVTLISINVSKANSINDTSKLKEKVSDEIDYLDFNIINIMNRLNNITVLKYKIYTQSVNTDKSGEGSASNSSGSASSQGSIADSSGSNSSSGQGGQSSSNQSTTNSQSQVASQNNSQNNSSLSSNSSNGTSTISQMLPSSGLMNVGNGNIDWSQIAYAVENVYATWPSINSDLQKLGLTQEQTNIFFTSIMGTMQSIKSQDKNSTLINLYNMYNELPKYKIYVTQDKYALNILNTKANVLYAYVLSNNDKWKEMSTSIADAKSTFSQTLNLLNDTDPRKTNLQTTYIILGELENAVSLSDKTLFLVNYKNVIQQLGTI